MRRCSEKQWFVAWAMTGDALLRATVASFSATETEIKSVHEYIHTQPNGVAVGVQLDDLLMALAERRIFPDTLFLEERGMVGETWSPESPVVTVTLRSALVL